MNFQEINDKINNELTINQVLWHYLKKQDNIRWDHKYTCPFHWDWQENTPSLNWSDSKQIFKCFWCWEFWWIIQFIKKYKWLTYFETLEEIKEEFWIDIKFDNSNFDDKAYKYKTLIFEFHEDINKKMIEDLDKFPEHLVYLRKDRQLTDDTIKRFKIGFSNWRDIETFAKKIIKTDKYKEIKLKDTWLFSNKENNLYFLFSDRIMFPICNNRWKIVWWSGWRIKEDQNPKYINSVNNLIYNKSSILFNFDKTNLHQSDILIICEWNLDSTQIYNFWWHNAVSLLWTNLTSDQIRLFKNKVTKVILALDQDEAWSEAIKKIAKKLYTEWIIPFIINLWQYKDIDDFLKNNKEQYFWKVDDFFIKNKVEILKDYYIKQYILNIDKFSIEYRYNILYEIREMYSSIKDEVLRNVYKYELEKHKIIFDQLEEEYIENKKKYENIEKEDKINNVKSWNSSTILWYVIYLIKNNKLDEEDIMWQNMELYTILQTDNDYINYDIKQFNEKFKEFILDFEKIEESEWLKKISEF